MPASLPINCNPQYGIYREISQKMALRCEGRGDFPQQNFMCTYWRWFHLSSQYTLAILRIINIVIKHTKITVSRKFY